MTAVTRRQAEETASTDSIPNPVKELGSLEELIGEANGAMIKPEGAKITNEAFLLIDGAPQIAEYKFIADGKECA